MNGREDMERIAELLLVLLEEKAVSAGSAPYIPSNSHPASCFTRLREDPAWFLEVLSCLERCLLQAAGNQPSRERKWQI